MFSQMRQFDYINVFRGIQQGVSDTEDHDSPKGLVTFHLVLESAGNLLDEERLGTHPSGVGNP